MVVMGKLWVVVMEIGLVVILMEEMEERKEESGGWPELGTSLAWVCRQSGTDGGGRVVLGWLVKWKKRERVRLRDEEKLI